MALGRRQLIVEVIGDEKALLSSFKRSEAAATSFNARITQIGKNVAGANRTASRFGGKEFLAGAAGGAGFLAASEAVTILTQSIGKGIAKSAQLQKSGEAIAATFGEAAQKVTDFSSKAANLGIDKVASQDVSAKIGILARNLGIGQEKAAEMAVGLQELAGSLGEIRGVDPAQFLQALPLILAGNVRGLKQMQIALTATEIKQEAVNLGLIKQGDALTASAKAQAIYALATRNLQTQLAEANRNSGDLTNQTHKLKANISNAEAAIGKLVRGPLTTLVRDVNHAATAIGFLTGKLGDLAKVKIPTINIPFTTANVGGGTVGHAFGQALHFSKFAAFPEIFAAKAIVDAVKGGGDEAGKQVTQAYRDSADKLFKQIQGLPKIPGATQKDFRNALEKAGFNAGNTVPAAQRQHDVPAEQRNRIFDSVLGRKEDLIQDIPTISGQISSLQKIAALITQRIAKTSDVTRKLTLEGKLADVLRTIKGDRQQVSQDLTDALRFDIAKAETTAGLGDDIRAADRLIANLEQRIKQEGRTTDLVQKIFQARQDRAAKIRQQRSARQFQALGLGPTGDAVIPGEDNLRKRLASITARIAGTTLDTAKVRAQLAGVRKVLTDEWGKATPEVRAKIDELFKTIRSGLDTGGDKLNKFKVRKPLDTQALFAQLGFPAGALRLAQARLQTPTFLTPSFGTGPALGAAGGAVFTVNTTVNLDGRKVATNTTKHQQKRRERNPLQRRG